jgi:tRNA threonylcarbamoyl adenosine modification protein (Sua5/YciO/YrdC/YwlC family)
MSQSQFVSQCTADALKQAAATLLHGDLVAFPTETVYGLGAIASDDDAVSRVFLAKGRPSDNPLIVHVADGEAGLRRVALGGNPPEIALKLGRRFWPGPLSICVLANTAEVGSKTRAGLNTVAVRRRRGSPAARSPRRRSRSRSRPRPARRDGAPRRPREAAPDCAYRCCS